MRSSDSRTLRWTVHLTAREYELLELLRADWGNFQPLSRAALLMAMAEHIMTSDEPPAPRVLDAWQRVAKELYFTNDHGGRGGRDPKLSLPRSAAVRP